MSAACADISLRALQCPPSLRWLPKSRAMWPRLAESRALWVKALPPGPRRCWARAFRAGSSAAFWASACASARRLRRRGRVSRGSRPRIRAIAQTRRRSSWERPTCCSGVSGTASAWLRQRAVWTRRPLRRSPQWHRPCGSTRSLRARHALKSSGWCLSSASVRR